MNPGLTQVIGHKDSAAVPSLALLIVRVLLAGADAAGLEAMFSTAHERRDAWLDSLLPPGE